MSRLAVTLIDVGWGDSIFIESQTDTSTHYALVDCNDTNISRSSFLFIKKHLEKKNVDFKANSHFFDFILLTHAHADHVSGIKQMMGHFGTDWYWYPKSDPNGALAATQHYANRYQNKVARHQAIHRDTILSDLGNVQLKVLWPPHTPGQQPYDLNNPNNNSVVLLLTLQKVRFVLTGDCEAENWQQINDAELKSRVKMFKFPHHGSYNGLFDDSGNTPWLDHLGVRTKLGLSLHIRHGHPHPNVINELTNRHFNLFRTDEHYHVTFETDGRKMNTKWARI